MKIPLFAGTKMKTSLPPKEELLEYLLSFDYFSRQGIADAGKDYATTHLQRFIRSAELIPRIKGEVRVLELGASPYFMTVLVQKYFGYQVAVANFSGDYEGSPSGPEETITLCSARFAETHRFPHKVFNVETDVFPYQDQSFDLVLCCELLEHLTMDPSHMLCEIHRVLKNNGNLLLTTPNVLRMHNLVTMLCGGNVYFNYSTDGVYGRHNREYTPDELRNLLRVHNFDSHVVAEDVYLNTPRCEIPLAIGQNVERGDTLFAVAKATGQAVCEYPKWLYLGWRQPKRNGSRSTAGANGG